MTAYSDASSRFSDLQLPARRVPSPVSICGGESTRFREDTLRAARTPSFPLISFPTYKYIHTISIEISKKSNEGLARWMSSLL